VDAAIEAPAVEGVFIRGEVFSDFGVADGENVWVLRVLILVGEYMAEIVPQVVRVPDCRRGLK
jgi:hypothetical protein